MNGALINKYYDMVNSELLNSILKLMQRKTNSLKDVISLILKLTCILFFCFEIFYLTLYSNT